MEIQVNYSGLEDKQIKIKEQEAKKLRMVHDNFDNPDWKHGDPQIGTMTFTDVVPFVIEPEPARDLKTEIDALKARIDKLEKK